MIKHVLRLITARFRDKSPRLVGECNQCGDCCRNLTLSNAGKLIRNEDEFHRLLEHRPEYRIFQPRHQDPFEQVLYFNCTQLGDDNRCQAYAARPRICRIYPNSKMFDHGARLPEACGYRLATVSEFSAVLKSVQNRRDK